MFSLNYDLLHYWARNQELPPADFSSDDGFRAGRRWNQDEANQDVFFLHGGLHLYDTGNDIKKLALKGSGDSIIDQVRDNLIEGRFPLFVSEPTADKKKSRIARNTYWNYCYRELSELNSALVVFGHSVHDNDKHIFDQIQRSGVTKVYVSLYGDENTPSNARTKANAQSFLAKDGRVIDFFLRSLRPCGNRLGYQIAYFFQLTLYYLFRDQRLRLHQLPTQRQNRHAMLSEGVDVKIPGVVG